MRGGQVVVAQGSAAAERKFPVGRVVHWKCAAPVGMELNAAGDLMEAPGLRVVRLLAPVMRLSRVAATGWRARPSCHVELRSVGDGHLGGDCHAPTWVQRECWSGAADGSDERGEAEQRRHLSRPISTTSTSQRSGAHCRSPAQPYPIDPGNTTSTATITA